MIAECGLLLEICIDLKTVWDPKLKNLASSKNIKVKKIGAIEPFWDLQVVLKWLIYKNTSVSQEISKRNSGTSNQIHDHSYFSYHACWTANTHQINYKTLCKVTETKSSTTGRASSIYSNEKNTGKILQEW